eukprot:CAMPEP_0179141630 /NCGR_PEP_ID=MMETSP0796-20121207/67952_1 /TAXON_ID=73915 /ORGANISM="Pyrodinium bahamense, Strain pbaha01" /LENGTH=149 /DNA_ID=CAMNT_0020841393 /DNA_START=143 /DNA_END=592 /DNA_ORIENTATION=-
MHELDVQRMVPNPPLVIGARDDDLSSGTTCGLAGSASAEVAAGAIWPAGEPPVAALGGGGGRLGRRRRPRCGASASSSSASAAAAGSAGPQPLWQGLRGGRHRAGPPDFARRFGLPATGTATLYSFMHGMFIMGLSLAVPTFSVRRLRV